MPHSTELNSAIKVRYRPIEAAIRWSGLLRHETRILRELETRALPSPTDFPQWPTLRLNAERIYDAIANQELPYAIGSAAESGEKPVDHPDLTVRHVDLRAWMTRYYPDQRPGFLFSELERRAHPLITIEAVNTLLFERDSLRSQLEQLKRGSQAARKTSASAGEATPTPRAETAYLHVVGALLDLLLGHAPSGQAYSSFRTQEAIISALIAQHGERLGISTRSLESKFAAARRALTK